MTIRRAGLVAAIVCAIAVAGCGLGAGAGTKNVTVTVTHDFGSRPVATLTKSRVPGSETVMRLLERAYPVKTSYGGGFVDAIDGLSRAGAHTDWFYYVNGVQADQGAATTSVHAGDRIWWDLHDWTATQSIPAVVGSYPAPFVSGFGGKRYPVTIECGTGLRTACTTVTDDLAREHVPSAPQALGTGSGPDTIGIVIGTWSQIRGQIDAQLIAHGPGASGVYARFAGPGGDHLQLLDPAGQVVRTLGGDTGLIAATAGPSGVPTWTITGTDAAGVAAAARALSAQALHDHFALVVSGTSRIPVPVVSSAAPS